MPRFTPRQTAGNEAFLDALRRTGNPRLAAASLAVHRSTYSKRRAKCAVFATRWDAAILACDAALKLGGGERPPGGPALRTRGGEIVVGRTRGGRLQLRRSPPGRMTAAGEQAFFRALAASANVRLSAAAAGFTHSAFYQKKKKRPAFASEMRYSLSVGWDRIHWALIDSADLECAPALAGWQDGSDDDRLPRMTVGQAIQLAHFHRGTALLEARLGARAERAPPETALDRSARERAEHYEATGSWRYAHEPPPPRLPPLHLVTGWSKASGKPAHNPDLALFGGWRIGDWHKRERKRGSSG